MPVTSDSEMASILSTSPMRRPRSADDDTEALRSQLMASIEQSESMPVIKTTRTSNITGIALEPPQINAQVDEDESFESALEDEDDEEDELAGSETTGEKHAHDTRSVTESESESSEVTSADTENQDVTMQEVDLDPTDSGQEVETTHTASRNVSVAADKVLDQSEVDMNKENEQPSNTDLDVEPHELGIDDEDETILVKPRQNAQQASDIENESASEDERDPCIFCGKEEAEKESSSPDITCAVCRRPAHYTCATKQDTSSISLDTWRCPTCTDNRTSASPKDAASKARSSAPRLVRDLLPVSRGLQKPGAHSIFAQPLIQEDDGGRSLRKRKSDPDERGPVRDRPRKKLRETPQPDKTDEDAISRATRGVSQKLTTSMPPIRTARILQHRPFHKPPPHKFILAFRLDQSKIATILAEPPRPSRRKYIKKKQKIPVAPPYQPPVPKFPALPTHHLIFPATFGDRDNDANAKPYGGILSETDADTTRSLPQMQDRESFEIARKEAEEERRRNTEKAEAEMNNLGEGANATNSKRTVSGPPSKIKCIQFGKHVIDTSYAAPYPEEYSHESRLFICEFCLKYLPSEFVAWRHKLKCPAKHPPGDEIYRDGSLSIWEVDGRKKTEYCQCLCLMAKLFLGSKTLYYDVDPFLFYILTEYDEYGYHFVGYFSKEKRPASQNNVSCILVMPIHQRKGYATFLIEFSYLLTRIEGKEGSPEKPLSDMGLTAYRSYWDLTLSRHLLELDNKPFSVKDIMLKTGMTADDVVHSLERLYAFIKDPVTKTYAVRYDRKLYESIVDKYDSKDFRKIRGDRLVWTPYIMGRSDAAALDAQPVKAIAQREEPTVIQENEADEDRISPKTKDVPNEEPRKDDVDPDLLSAVGHIAPGPPSTQALNPPEQPSQDSTSDIPLVNGDAEEGKASAHGGLSGYALTYQVEKIPPTRFQIDPPIPTSMLRFAKSRRKSALGTPKTNGKAGIRKPTTPQAIRSSPRKAASINGSIRGRSSRTSTPDRAPASVRRSNRKSGLANEITTDKSSNQDEEEDEEEEEDEDGEEEEDDEDEEAIIDDDEEGIELKTPTARNATDVNSVDDSGSGSEEEEEEDDQSESASSDNEEGVEEVQDSASDDPDAEVEEAEDDSEEESGEEDEGEIDIPSAPTSDAEGSEGSDEED